MKGYKGFNKDFCCHPDGGEKVQYKVGETVKHCGKLSLCASGIHFCEDALDVIRYYCGSSRYAEVEAEDVSDEKKDDSKRVCKSLTVRSELSLSDLLGIGIKARLDKFDFKNAPDKATGSHGAASATGYHGAASATGDHGAASATGDEGAASATGDEGAASALGIEGKAKGAVGCWLTIAEWKNEEGKGYKRVGIKTARVDGKRIKADIFYKLKGGKFVEVK